MIVANDGHVMCDGKSVELLLDFACVIASIKKMVTNRFDEETALRIIAECGRFGIEAQENSVIDMQEFEKRIREAVKGEECLTN